MTFDSVESWLTAVKNSAAFTKSEDRFTPNVKRHEEILHLGTYRFEDLKNPSLKLPDMPDDTVGVDPNFNVYKNDTTLIPLDLRKLGAGLNDGWKPVIGTVPTPTAFEFKKYVTDQTMDADPENANPDFRDLANHSIFAENTLRTLTNEPSIDRLTDDTKYPLFIWALMMNLPDKPVQAAPTLVPKDEEPVSQVEPTT